MEPFTPARALVMTGASLALLVGTAAAAPHSGSAVARPGTGSSVREASVLPAASAHPAARRTTKRWAGSISVHRRSAVESAYARSFASGLDTETGWTGSHDHQRSSSNGMQRTTVSQFSHDRLPLTISVP